MLPDACTERYRNSYPSASRVSPRYATLKPTKAPRWLPTSAAASDRVTSGASRTLTRSVRTRDGGGDATGSDVAANKPRYQFRKSNSMKLALREMDEGVMSRSFV